MSNTPKADEDVVSPSIGDVVHYVPSSQYSGHFAGETVPNFACCPAIITRVLSDDELLPVYLTVFGIKNDLKIAEVEYSELGHKGTWHQAGDC